MTDEKDIVSCDNDADSHNGKCYRNKRAAYYYPRSASAYLCARVV